jgi:FMN phosphatase YigB (HAD superfamily)
MFFKKKLNQINGIVFFDIDDTLLNTSYYHKQVREYVFYKLIDFGLNTTVNDLWDLFWKIYKEYGSNYTQHYERMLETLNLSKDDYLKFKDLAISSHRRFRDENLRFYLVEGSEDLLRYLKENNFLLGIISSGVYQKQIEKLIFLNLLNFFEKDLINIQLNKDFKLYNEIYSSVINKYKVKNIWLIGDREDKDIVPAKKSGFKTIRIKNGKYQFDFNESIADFKFNSLKEINLKFFF